MNKLNTKALSSFKYIYLVVFFALLSGFFNPIITNSSFDPVVVGVIVLFVGLAGGILLYKAATGEKRQKIYLGSGFALIGVSLFFIIQMTGRI